MSDRKGGAMTIFGVALLAICTMAGVFFGDLLGILLGVKANVGGVGLAMFLLIAVRVWLKRQRGLSYGITSGVEFWGAMYIPIVVAMAAQQNVVAALRGGPLVLIAAFGTVALCFAATALFGQLSQRRINNAERELNVERGGEIIGGDFSPTISAKKA